MKNTRILNIRDLLERNLRLDEGMTHADFGTGTSPQFVLHASDIVGDAGKVCALDILKHSLDVIDSHARNAGKKNIQSMWSDLEVYGGANQIRSNEVDRISMVNFLHQIQRGEHLFNEANRVLKAGGYCLVVDWDDSHSIMGPPQENRINIDKVRKMARVVGWEEVESLIPGPYHFGVVFRKLL